MTDKKQENLLVSKLAAFGLSSAEARVYLYLLDRGSEAGGSKIAQGSGLHRQYVYLALPTLIEKGLVGEISHGKQHKYKARSPLEIEKLGRRKALEAGDLARELNLVSNIGNEQDFEVIQGERAIQQYEMQMIDEYEEGAEEYIIGGPSEGFSRVMGDLLPEYLEEKARKKIVVKYIGCPDERELYEKYIGKYSNQEYRFMEKLPRGETHMVMRKDSVSFYSFLTPPLVYVVKSPVVAENYKAFFMMLWEMAK